MVTNSQNQLKEVIHVYSKQKTFSDIAKKVYKGSLFRLFSKEISSEKWESTFREWIAEFHDIEDKRSLIPWLSYTGESSREFFPRLICKLQMRGFFSLEERNMMLNNFISKKTLLKPISIDAQILLLKAFFELSRQREIVNSVSTVYLPNVRTIDELISYPPEIPLPTSELTHYIFDVQIPEGYENNTEFIRYLLQDRLVWMNPDVVEYHLFYSYFSIEWNYHQAIKSIALEYPSLRGAYEIFKQRNGKNDDEMAFINRYPHYWKKISGRLGLVYDPSKGLVIPPWIKDIPQ